tara:strand:+ start:2964 stop:3617 length:654 start_codon:yes stop_codon:yes gene_type:complete
MTGTIQHKLDIAYREFNNKVNQIVNSEISKCNNNQSTLNKDEYVKGLDSLIIDLQLGESQKDYRRVPQSYSPYSPDINISPNEFKDDDLSIKDIQTPTQVPSHWTPDKSRQEARRKLSKLKCDELTPYQCRDNPNCILDKATFKCKSKFDSNINNVNPIHNHHLFQRKKIKTCQAECSVYNKGWKAKKVCNKEGKNCEIKCFAGDNLKKTLTADCTI